MSQPTLKTARFQIRPFAMRDAAQIQLLAGDPLVAETTLNLPHPYLDGMAELWLATHAALWEAQEGITLAIVGADDALRGAIGLTITRAHDRGELGYWIGRPFWGNGIATEAARALIAYGFTQLGLYRIQASHFPRNPASGRVLEKCGLKREGLHQARYRKGDRYEDVVEYAILRSEWSALAARDD